MHGRIRRGAGDRSMKALLLTAAQAAIVVAITNTAPVITGPAPCDIVASITNTTTVLTNAAPSDWWVCTTNLIGDVSLGYGFRWVSAEEMIDDWRDHQPEDITNAVNLLAESGDICKVYGHSWRSGYFNAYHPNTMYRTCRICGECQSQSHEWK